MRAFALLVLGLAACSAAPPPAAEAEPPLMGRLVAASPEAAVRAGDVQVERGGLVFDKGVTLYTRVLRERRATEAVAQGGESYAALALARVDAEVELRRVTSQTRVPEGASFCANNAAPTYVAFVHDAAKTEATLIVFSGIDAPGPQARDSTICGAFAYRAA